MEEIYFWNLLVLFGEYTVCSWTLELQKNHIVILFDWYYNYYRFTILKMHMMWLFKRICTKEVVFLKPIVNLCIFTILNPKLYLNTYFDMNKYCASCHLNIAQVHFFFFLLHYESLCSLNINNRSEASVSFLFWLSSFLYACLISIHYGKPNRNNYPLKNNLCAISGCKWIRNMALHSLLICACTMSCTAYNNSPAVLHCGFQHASEYM